MWDTKRQIQFTGIRHYTINIKNTQFDVNFSEIQNSVDFCARFQPWGENIRSPFLILKTVLIAETTERQIHCVLICIKNNVSLIMTSNR